jgi:two-component system copper resistance phosphate regulon response regulator CusR
MKLLLVEDDEEIVHHLSAGLKIAGFDVTSVGTGMAALDSVYAGHFDAMILDVMIPGLTGWQVLSLLREDGIMLPVLMLTALDSLENRLRGLNAGADDYVVKPFALSEIVARLHAILRRGTVLSDEVLTHRDLVVDTRRQTARRGSRNLDLTQKELRLITLFLEHKDQVLSRAYILERVWDMNFASDGNVVDVCIRRLRAKIDDPSPEKLLHTIRGRGYVLR